MRNKIFDRDEMQAVAFCKHLQIRKAGHAAVIVCDLADDARGRKTGELSKIDSRFCMSGAREHAVWVRPKRKDVTRTRELFRT